MQTIVIEQHINDVDASRRAMYDALVQSHFKNEKHSINESQRIDEFAMLLGGAVLAAVLFPALTEGVNGLKEFVGALGGLKEVHRRLWGKDKKKNNDEEQKQSSTNDKTSDANTQTKEIEFDEKSESIFRQRMIESTMCKKQLEMADLKKQIAKAKKEYMPKTTINDLKAKLEKTQKDYKTFVVGCYDEHGHIRSQQDMETSFETLMGHDAFTKFIEDGKTCVREMKKNPQAVRDVLNEYGSYNDNQLRRSKTAMACDRLSFHVEGQNSILEQEYAKRIANTKDKDEKRRLKDELKSKKNDLKQQINPLKKELSKSLGVDVPVTDKEIDALLKGEPSEKTTTTRASGVAAQIEGGDDADVVVPHVDKDGDFDGKYMVKKTKDKDGNTRYVMRDSDGEETEISKEEFDNECKHTNSFTPVDDVEQLSQGEDVELDDDDTGEGEDVDDEVDDDDFKTTKTTKNKVKNPATIWKRRKKEDGTGLTKSYYNAKGDSISADEYHARCKKFNERVARAKQKKESRMTRRTLSQLFESRMNK